MKTDEGFNLNVSPPDAEHILYEVETVRRFNNVCWMGILRIAYRADPDNTKRLLRHINDHDRKISDLLGKLAND